MYSNEGLFSRRTSDIIISSTSVASSVLSPDILQRQADKTVIRKSCPVGGWCRITTYIAEQSHTICLIYCLVSRDVINARRNWKIIKKQKNKKKCWKLELMSLYIWTILKLVYIKLELLFYFSFFNNFFFYSLLPSFPFSHLQTWVH